MTPKQKQDVRISFELIAPIAPQVSDLFYERLFELAPHTRPLFHHSMDAQGEKLMQTLEAAVTYLDRIEELIPTIQQMGMRHARYGVTDGDYEHVGEALLWALTQGVGEAFTFEVEQAWAAIYKLLADTMKSGVPKPVERLSY